MSNLSQDANHPHIQLQHSYTHDATEGHRLEVLRKTSLLDSSAEEAFDRLTRLACHALNVPVSLVSLVDDRRQFFKSQTGLKQPWCDLRETPLSHSFCKHVVISGEPFIINDSRTVEMVMKNMAVKELSVIAYLGIPLRLNSGVILGSLCAIDDKPKEWTPDDIEILSTLAASAVSEIDLRLSHQNLNEIIKTISHDLKNPISAIQLSAQMMNRKLNKKIQTHEIKSGLDKILDLTKKMNSLVTNLLDRSKEQTLQSSLEFSDCELNVILGTVENHMSVMANQKRLKLENKILQGGTITCDKNQLIQALSNLVSNAINHSPQDSTILIQGKRGPSSLLISVEDSGVGIPPEALPHVFDKNWKENDSSSGHGLGLYIVREIVLAHNGEISIQSELGIGTKVTFSIPQSFHS